MKKVNVVIPTIRSEDFFRGFLENWKDEFGGCNIIIIEDRQVKILDSLVKDYSNRYNFTYQIYDWTDIDQDLKDDSWIICRQTDVVRNYGYLKAYHNNPLFILTLDDDVKPADKNYIIKHYDNLFNKRAKDNYFSTMPQNNVRGSEVFENNGEIVISHSGWVGQPDYSAKEQTLTMSSVSYKADKQDFYDGVIPRYNYYSMCGMALAWKPEYTHLMYFPMQGMKDWGIDRCGDIWAGFYSKIFLERIGRYVYSGSPFVHHDRASNVWSSLYKEEDSDIKGRAFINWAIAGEKDKILKDYLTKLEKALKIWNKLLNKKVIVEVRRFKKDDNPIAATVMFIKK